MTPIEILKEEHKVIRLVILAVEREVKFIRAAGRIRADFVEKFIDFTRNFTDLCYHAKEEKLLFAKISERGMGPKAEPIARRLLEHDEARMRVKAIADKLPGAQKGDSRAVAAVAAHLSAYVTLLRDHSDREDHDLFPMAQELLTVQDHQALLEEFRKIEVAGRGEASHRKYVQLANELARA